MANEGIDISEHEWIIETLGQFPHCDSRVLHAPGLCRFCDMHPEWQALRMHYRINFTGENFPWKSQCPAEKFRSAETIHLWRGNQAQ